MNKYTKFITSLLIMLGTTTAYGSAGSSGGGASSSGAGSGASGTGATGAGAGQGTDSSSTLNNSTQNITTESSKLNTPDTTSNNVKSHQSTPIQSNISGSSGTSDGTLNSSTDESSSYERYTDDSDPVSYDNDDVDHDGGEEVYPSTADEY